MKSNSKNFILNWIYQRKKKNKMDSKVKKLLETDKIKYKLLPHRKVYTAFTSAETQHMDTKQIVKVVLAKLSKPSVHLLKGGGPAVLDFVFVAVPAGKRVDLKQ